MRKHGLSSRGRLAHLTKLEHLTEDRAVFAHVEHLHLLQHLILQHPVRFQKCRHGMSNIKAEDGMM